MARGISQRELRNDNGEIMRRLDKGETFVVTRNGTPVGELAPLRGRRFVTAEAAPAIFQGAPAVDLVKLRVDLDEVASQSARPLA
jgi:antitoxin (DNA-binding transcriptional repressor) of toxin-antitoxin stability system